MQTLENVKHVLEQLKPELHEKFHVQSIGIFGSIVRDDFNSDSDIDLLVNFDKPIGIEFIDLADFIESQLHQKVDLVSRAGIKDKYFKFIEKDIVYV